MKPTKLERNCQAATGMSMADYFEACKTSSITMKAMAQKLGVSRSTINKWATRNGKSWDVTGVSGLRRSWGFTHRGFFGTQKQHCDHHGVSYHATRSMVHRCGLPFADALDKQIRCKAQRDEQVIGIKRRIAAAGVAQSYVYQIKREYGITSPEALEVAMARKAAKAMRRAA